MLHILIRLERTGVTTTLGCATKAWHLMGRGLACIDVINFLRAMLGCSDADMGTRELTD